MQYQQQQKQVLTLRIIQNEGLYVIKRHALHRLSGQPVEVDETDFNCETCNENNMKIERTRCSGHHEKARMERDTVCAVSYKILNEGIILTLIESRHREIGCYFIKAGSSNET
jgi:hypothetical protein